MKRRDFITLLGGAAAAWPIAARAQQQARLRRIGVLLAGAEGDPLYHSYLVMLREVLARAGWIEGRNLQIDLRYGAGDPARTRTAAEDLTKLAPELILTNGSAATRAVQQRTKTIPIIFLRVGDPVVSGIVESIARPEGNTTGITDFYPSLGSKWLELLKEVAPRVTRVALVYGPDTYSGTHFDPIAAAASALGMQAIKTPIRNAMEVVRAIDAFAAEPNGALLAMPEPTASTHRNSIIALAAHHRLPAIYSSRSFAFEGGLMVYGVEDADLARRAATYVDHVLRGAKVSELPVQFPTKFELVVNLKTAKAIGLAIPETFLVRADEVIE